MKDDRAARWFKRGLWLLALWALGVIAVGTLAMLLKWSMRAAGLGG